MRQQSHRHPARSNQCAWLAIIAALSIVPACVKTQRASKGVSTTRPADASLGGDRWEDYRGLLAGGLVGSKHDFSQDGENPRDLCLSCHTPHITATRAPLLDRAPRPARAAALRQAFGDELNSASLLCLSCHDGVTAPDVYTSSHAMKWSSQLGTMQLGARPLSSHPVGAKYPIAESTYHGSDEVQSDGRIKLPGGRIQCTSCHDPHNTERHPSMLVKSNSRSGLCLSCHRL